MAKKNIKPAKKEIFQFIWLNKFKYYYILVRKITLKMYIPLLLSICLGTRLDWSVDGLKV